MELKHGSVYCCRRLRLLEYLLAEGFEPFATIPEAENYKFKNWLFKNSEALEKAINNYFTDKNSNNVHK